VVDPVAPCAGSARIGTGSYQCRYAGAMMLFPYLNLVGAQGIFAMLTGGPARRYGDLHVLTTATLGFALGAGTVEGTKHLPRAEVGAAVGLAATPALGTLRSRLSALADNADVGPAKGVRGGDARRGPGRRRGVLRRRPLRSLCRRPAGRQRVEHQTPPRCSSNVLLFALGISSPTSASGGRSYVAHRHAERLSMPAFCCMPGC
jgi:hypothetical protein